MLHEPPPAPSSSTTRSSSHPARSRCPRCREVAVHTRRFPMTAGDGALAVAPSGSIPADRVVALPRLRGRPIEGIPRDGNGFVPTDPHGRVAGLADVFAAGDVTAFPVKQGG